MKIEQITKCEYAIIQKIYNVLNHRLFKGELRDCLITLQCRQNSPSSFSPEKFSSRGSKVKVDEISLNPDTFGASDEIIISNLAHEMVHLWNYHNGTISTTTPRYHNQAWVEKMLSIGLKPISHDTPSMCGQKVSHEIIPSGKFQTVVRSLIEKDIKLNWKSKDFFSDGEFGSLELEKPKPVSKVKFHCTKCGQNAWAKETASLICGICFINMAIDYS